MRPISAIAPMVEVGRASRRTPASVVGAAASDRPSRSRSSRRPRCASDGLGGGRRGGPRRTPRRRRPACRPARGRPGAARRLVGDLHQPAPQRHEAAEQVAAVHRRDVGRRQGLERPRVVPVVEVAPVPLHLVEGVERLLQPLDQGAQCRGSRGRGPRASRAAAAPGSSATCGARPGRRALPGSCPAAASGPRRRRTSRRSARSCGPIVRRTAASSARQRLLGARPSGGSPRRRPAGESTHASSTGDAAGSDAGRTFAHQHARSPPAIAGDGPHRQRRTSRAPRRGGARSSRRSPIRACSCATRTAGRACGASRRPGSSPGRPGTRSPSRPGPASPARCPRHRLNGDSERPRIAETNVPTTSWTATGRAPRAPSSVQNHGEPGRTVQPSTNSTISAGGTRLRRRLSKSFQRSSVGSGFVPQGRRASGSAMAAEPRQQLPVAADPAVLAAGVGVVAGGEVVEKLGVGQQAAAGEVALDQVVAEDRVLGERVPRGGLEGVEVVDPLARERADPEQVHVGVAGRRRVRVDPARRRQQAREPRVRRGRQVEAHARLEHAVPFDHAAEPSGRTSARFSGCASVPTMPAGRVAGHLRVGVERDDEPDVARAARGRRSGPHSSCRPRRGPGG